jgi:hypothetical protein
MELELFASIVRTIQNTNPIYQRRLKQFPEYAEAQRAVVYHRLERMDHELDRHEFIASDRFTPRRSTIWKWVLGEKRLAI